MKKGGQECKPGHIQRLEEGRDAEGSLLHVKVKGRGGTRW